MLDGPIGHVDEAQNVAAMPLVPSFFQVSTQQLRPLMLAANIWDFWDIRAYQLGQDSQALKHQLSHSAAQWLENGCVPSLSTLEECLADVATQLRLYDPKRPNELEGLMALCSAAKAPERYIKIAADRMDMAAEPVVERTQKDVHALPKVLVLAEAADMAPEQRTALLGCVGFDRLMNLRLQQMGCSSDVVSDALGMSRSFLRSRMICAKQRPGPVFIESRAPKQLLALALVMGMTDADMVAHLCKQAGHEDQTPDVLARLEAVVAADPEAIGALKKPAVDVAMQQQELMQYKDLKSFMRVRTHQIDQTQQAIAAKLGVSRATLYLRMDAENVAVSSVSRLARLSHALELTEPNVIGHLCKMVGREAWSQQVVESTERLASAGLGR